MKGVISSARNVLRMRIAISGLNRCDERPQSYQSRECLARHFLVPAVPSRRTPPEQKDDERVRPDERAPETPLVEAARRRRHTHVVDKPDAAAAPSRESLQTLIKINVLTHKQRLVVAVHRGECVITTELRRTLRQPRQPPDDAPRT